MGTHRFGISVLVRLLPAMALCAENAWAADDYPSKPIRLIAPFSPSGGVDILARGIASRVGESLKQPVVIDNRAGGGGSAGAELTARAAPDGYTLIIPSANLVIYPFMYPAAYDPIRDFAPVTQAISLPFLLASSATLPVKSVSELIALAREKPGAINYASAGSGSLPHLTGELFKRTVMLNLVHVPYKGNAAALPDLIAGQVHVLFAVIPTVLPHVKTGRLRGLAVTTRTRAKSAPEFPTLDESGVPGFDVTQWYGVLAPAKTPKPIIDRLHKEIAAALRQPDFVARMAVESFEPVASSPEQFGQYLRAEREKWGTLIKQTGIRGD